MCPHASAVPNVGVPVSEMKDEYTKESATLSEAIIKYSTLDPYDPQRVQVINVSPQKPVHTALSACPALFTHPFVLVLIVPQHAASRIVGVTETLTYCTVRLLSALHTSLCCF